MTLKESVQKTKSILTLLNRLDISMGFELQAVWQAKLVAVQSGDEAGIEHATGREEEFLAKVRANQPRGFAVSSETRDVLKVLGDKIAEAAEDREDRTEERLKALSHFSLDIDHRRELDRIYAAAASGDEWRVIKAERARPKLFTKICEDMAVRALEKAKDLETSEQESDQLLDAIEWLQERAENGLSAKDESALLAAING